MDPLIAATSIVQRLKEAGHTAYFAGGWVRDLLMDHPSDDIDIATTASAQNVQELFEKTVPVGVQFGIVIVVIEGQMFEVATFRTESGYLDGRRPTEIRPATAEEDAARRDFTINGLFYDPLTKELLDFVGGKQDIERKIVRAIGDPHQRLLEDRLRMMRAIRYSTRFDFAIDPATYEAICYHAKELFPAVAIERVWQELDKMARFAHMSTGLVMLHEVGLLATIFPALAQIPTAEIARRLQHLPRFPRDTPTILQLLQLFLGSSLDEKLALVDYMKLSRQERRWVEAYHRWEELLGMPAAWQQQLELYEWAKLYSEEEAALCLQLFAARLPADESASLVDAHAERQQQLSPWIERMRHKDPLLRAQHLAAKGVPPGPRMGQLLQQAERIAVNEQILSPEELLSRLSL